MRELWVVACYFARNVMKFLRERLRVLSDMINCPFKCEVYFPNLQI